MKLLSLAGAALAVTMTAQPTYAEKPDAPKFADVTVAELQAAIKDKKVFVIDVNQMKSYNAGHIPGAVHFPTLRKKGLKAVLPEDKAALVVAYCSGPQWSAWKKAAVAAQKAGYTNVKHLSVGISGWKEAKAETETGNLKPLAPKGKKGDKKKPDAAVPA